MADRINVTRSSMPPFEEYVEEIKPIWESRWLTNAGEKHQKLQAELCDLLQVPHMELFSNGHQALEAAFSIFPAGSEVITTPFTFASTTLAIARAGLIPVFCDIEPDFYTLDPEKIEPLITEKTVAIAPVHVYGNLCQWRKIEEIAKKHNLKVFYDAAHAFGVRDGDVSAACLGDISMFSFHATKVFHTIEGGALAYHDDGLAKYFAAFRQFGMFDGVQSEILGTNAKLTEFAAAMGLCNLRHLDEQIDLRRRVFERYHERLDGKHGIVLCGKQAGVVPNYAYFPVRIVPEAFGLTRDQVCDRLAEQNIFARKYFFPLTSQFPAIKGYCDTQGTPVAEKVTQEILCLPMYADLSMADVDRICDVLLHKE